jgi:hypothetical protein
MPTYSQLPSPSQWQKDSTVSLAFRKDDRKNDPILIRIDTIVEALNGTKSGGESLYLYAELYFATNYWLKTLTLRHDPKMQKGRETAIRDLCRFAITKLAAACQVSIQALPNELEKLYGKGLSEHGKHQDSAQALGVSHYMERAETNRYRVHFIGGKAYQEEWRVPNPKLKLVDSIFWHESTANRNEVALLPGPDGNLRQVQVLEYLWAYFVMSMSRDIYMGPHMSISKGSDSEGKVGVVHSSWLAGTAVQCSGSMLIEKGVVKGIRNNSGHYQPSDNHMVNVLELLRTVGVPLKDVEVVDYMNDRQLSGDEFLAERGNWDNILKRSKWRPPEKKVITPSASVVKPPVTIFPGGKLKK